MLAMVGAESLRGTKALGLHKLSVGTQIIIAKEPQLLRSAREAQTSTPRGLWGAQTAARAPL